MKLLDGVDPSHIVSQLRSRGINVWAEGGTIRIRPTGTQRLTDFELNVIRSLKATMISFLEGSQSLDDVPIDSKSTYVPLELTGAQSIPTYYSKLLGSRIGAITIAFRLTGPLDVGLLRECINQLQLRHDALRIGVDCLADKVTQTTTPLDCSRCRVLRSAADNLTTSAELVRDQLHEIIADRNSRPHGPTFDSLILKANDNEHLLVIVVDHIVVDGISIDILLSELWIMYDSMACAQKFKLQSSPVQFSSYAAWLSRVFPLWKQRHAPYWESRLSGANRSSLKYSRRVLETLAWSSSQHELSARALDGLTAISREFRVMPNMVLLAAYVAVMSDVLDQTDLTIIFVDNCRHRAELIPMVGCLAALLYLRTDVHNAMPFIDLVRNVTSEYQSACEHHDFGWLPAVNDNARSDLLFNAVADDSQGAFSRRNLASHVAIDSFPAPHSESQLRALYEAFWFSFSLGLYVSSEKVIAYFSSDDRLMAPSPQTIGSLFLGLLEEAILNPVGRLDRLKRRSN